MTPTTPERRHLDRVLQAVRNAVATGEMIKLPDFDGTLRGSGETALHLVGIEDNPFGGNLGDFRYQFEGEEDLLHLFVVRLDGSPLTPEEGQAVAGTVLDGVPPGLVWFKPGHYTQHFYFGHELLP